MLPSAALTQIVDLTSTCHLLLRVLLWILGASMSRSLHNPCQEAMQCGAGIEYLLRA